MNTDPTLKPNRTADWYMDVVWPLLPVPGEFDGMDACDQLRWRSVVRLAIEYVLCGERGTPPSSKTPHCPKGDGPCIRGCKNWECRDGWPDDPTLKPDIAARKTRLLCGAWRNCMSWGLTLPVTGPPSAGPVDWRVSRLAGACVTCHGVRYCSHCGTVPPGEKR